MVFVSDMDAALAFYVEQLGFTEHWRHAESGTTIVAQVDRMGWFVSLDVDVLDAVRTELEARGVVIKDGEWGYRVMIVVDPDGNELYFPYPAT